jgi:hypothetical protein
MIFRTQQDRDGIFQQRRNTMNYTKPQVATLGQAVRVIENLTPVKPNTPYTDGNNMIQPFHNPAYDLDE